MELHRQGSWQTSNISLCLSAFLPSRDRLADDLQAVSRGCDISVSWSHFFFSLRSNFHALLSSWAAADPAAPGACMTRIVWRLWYSLMTSRACETDTWRSSSFQSGYSVFREYKEGEYKKRTCMAGLRPKTSERVYYDSYNKSVFILLESLDHGKSFHCSSWPSQWSWKVRHHYGLSAVDSSIVGWKCFLVARELHVCMHIHMHWGSG